MRSFCERRPRGPRDPASQRTDRRSFLARLLWGILAFVIARPVAALPAPRSGFSAADLDWAALGRGYALREPARAALVVSEVESRFSSLLRSASPSQRAQRIRAQLLDDARVARDFRDARVIELEGWVLSRSEAMVAIYLHHLTTLEAPGTR